MRQLPALAGMTVLLLIGCGGPPPPAPVAVQATDPAAEARKAVVRRDWAAAAPLLREAITRDPDNLALHYNLAVCATELDSRDEAIREFQWVLAHGPVDSEEARTARAWLAEATAGKRAPSEGAPVVDEKLGDSGLVGQVMLPGGNAEPARRKQLHLMGLPDTPTKTLRYIIRSDEDGRYAFTRVVAGTYKLTDAYAAAPIWRLRIQLEPGKETVLDLTPQNSVKVRDDFPERSQ